VNGSGWRIVLAVTFADLRFRARQFAIAIIGVGLVLSMALLLTGLAAGFRAEVADTVDGVGAHTWVLSKTAQGRITAFAAFSDLQALAIQNESSADHAAPLLVAPFQVAHGDNKTLTVNLVGVAIGRLGDPQVTSGHRLSGPDDVVVNATLKLANGSIVAIGGKTFHVVGQVTHRTLVGGGPLMYMPLLSAQEVVTSGQPLITAVVTSGTPARIPGGLVALSPNQVINDTVGQLSTAISSIESTRWLMWTVAAAIVASLLYVAALERRRDFAVLKALGSSSRALFLSLVMEAVVVTLMATVLAELVVNLLVPFFSQPVDITFTAYATLPAIAVVVGVLASVSALRRVTGADPAAAFG
jgi:putative ABC transport system permease protein